jgi:hypothetical protein
MQSQDPNPTSPEEILVADLAAPPLETKVELAAPTENVIRFQVATDG